MTKGHFFEQFDDIPKIQIAVTKDDYKKKYSTTKIKNEIKVV